MTRKEGERKQGEGIPGFGMQWSKDAVDERATRKERKVNLKGNGRKGEKRETRGRNTIEHGTWH